MTGIEIVGLVSAVGPFVIATVKKVLPVKKIKNDNVRATVNQSLALLIGLAASVTNAALTQCPDPAVADCVINWGGAIITGLAAGAGASYVRDTDKNVLGVAKALFTLKEKAKGKVS